MSNTTNNPIENKIRSLFKYWYLLVVLVFIGSILAQGASAAEFAQAYIRLDRVKANTALSGTVCAKPSSAGAGTEAKVLVAFPSDFSLSTNTANWTTGTSNLPDGATAWPGIGGAATTVSGQIVTFASSDLTSGSALYCFNFTASSSTTGSSGEKSGAITTKNSSNTTIDSSDYGVSIVSNDQITVNATVAADANDYSAVIAKVTSTPASGNFPENSEIEYQVTYGTSLTYATNITLQASWSQGTIEGQSSPSVDVLTYVTGSAGNAYSSTPPVIDTINRTITWEINNFPGSTVNQTVNYKVKTTSNYTGSSRVSFTNSALINFPGGSTTANELTAYYKYSASTTTSTTSGPTSTPTPAPSTTVTKPTIQIIEVREIFDNSASIFVQTSPATTKIIRFGKSISNLNQSVSAKLSLSNVINLAGLDPDTKYYFRVYATDASNNQTISDLYTFTTAQSSEPLLADLSSFVATSHDIILSLLRGRAEKVPVKNNYIVLPKDTVFHFKFSMQDRIPAIKTQALIRNKNILGVFSFPTKAQASTEIVDLIEIEPGVYSGNLKTKSETGEYEIYARITDKNGNISEQKIANLRVINKFSVLSKETKEPDEGARVLIYIFNPTTRTYQVIPSGNILSGNPLFTDRNGELDLVLPQAKYKAEVSNLRFEDKTVEFEIGIKEGQEFPAVYLEKAGLTPFRLLRYYLRGLNDVFIFNTQIYSEILTGSSRFFDLVAALTLGALVIMALFAFSKKHHIPLSNMASYFYYLVDRKDKNGRYIHGVVYDEKDKPIPGANVYLTDKKNEKIVSSSKANRNGEFFFRKGSSQYLIMAMARNYKTSPQIEYHDKEHLKFKITLELSHEGLNLIENAGHVISRFTGMGFEVFLVASVVFEFLFLNSFGIVRTLPFLAISVFNILIWTLHLRHIHQR